MEQFPQEEIELFRIRWHERVKDDLKNVPKHAIQSMADHVEHILTHYPYLAGEHVQGKNSTLRRIKHASYRILFTVVGEMKEVWIIAVQPRKSVYRFESLDALIRMAIIVHQHRSK